METKFLENSRMENLGLCTISCSSIHTKLENSNMLVYIDDLGQLVISLEKNKDNKIECNAIDQNEETTEMLLIIRSVIDNLLIQVNQIKQELDKKEI